MKNNKAQRYRIELGKWQQPAAQKDRQTIIIGHKNPDTDSVAAAAGYAFYKEMMGEEGYIAACAGLPQKRTKFIFKKFGVSLPVIVNDVWPRVSDISHESEQPLRDNQTILEATESLRKDRLERLPVVDKDNKYIGMVSLFDLADRLFQSSGNIGEGILDRSVNSSIKLAADALEAQKLTVCDEDELVLMQVYVGAMNLYHMKSRLMENDPRSAALVVGDRGEIHNLAVELGIRLLVITGGCEIDPEFIKQAKNNGVSILRTNHDSASTVRRLKFSSPLNMSLDEHARPYTMSERLCDIKREVLSANYDGFPVVDNNGQFSGMFYKRDLQKDSPTGLVLVDHNELSQAVDGACDVPVREIIDHHRLAMESTDQPIRVCNDIVGSTCTLIAEQFRQSNLIPTRAIAGILLGGIVTDTLLLRSPTSTMRDKVMLEWLAELADCDPQQLEEDILASGSPLANLSPTELVEADLKNYNENNFSFSIGQIEEAGFENLAKRKDELQAEMEKQVKERGLDFIGLLVTNIVRSTSVMLVAGNDTLLSMLPYEKLDAGIYDLPGVVSRKKQLLPVLLNITSVTV